MNKNLKLTTALIFAAGRGERMRPFTNHTPKPLYPVHGIPLIEHHVRKLAEAGFTRVIINHAHLGDQIRQHLGNGQRFGIEICYCPEPPGALETGGAIVNALPLINHEHFLTLNADIFTDYPLNQFTKPQHLILVPQPAYLPKADFGLSHNHYVTLSNIQYTFSGIACYSKSQFKQQPFGRYSLVPWLKSQIEQQKITGEIYLGPWVVIDKLGIIETCTK